MDRVLAPFTETSQCAAKSFTPEGRDRRVFQIAQIEQAPAFFDPDNGHKHQMIAMTLFPLQNSPAEIKRRCLGCLLTRI